MWIPACAGMTDYDAGRRPALKRGSAELFFNSAALGVGDRKSRGLIRQLRACILGSDVRKLYPATQARTATSEDGRSATWRVGKECSAPFALKRCGFGRPSRRGWSTIGDEPAQTLQVGTDAPSNRVINSPVRRAGGPKRAGRRNLFNLCAVHHLTASPANFLFPGYSTSPNHLSQIQLKLSG